MTDSANDPNAPDHANPANNHHGPEFDKLTGQHTTGHEWDGVKELNTPLPKWWLNIFYASIVFSVGYVIAYPAIPLVTEATRGVLGDSTRANVAAAIETHAAAQAPWRDRIAAASFTEIQADEDLLRFALRAGRSNFAVHCSQCHGAGAQGFPGYPNLNDDDWLWGGTVTDIHHTIAHGVRNETDEARFSQMPAFEGVLSEEEIADTAQHVLALGDLAHDADAAARGATVYAAQCASCHGDNGEGDREQGAPRLADAIWLLAGDADRIAAQIAQPAHGVMPAWGQRLDDAEVKELALYVHSLGGGE